MSDSPSVTLHTRLDRSTAVELRKLLDEAFDGDIGDTNWEHALGGTHALVWIDRAIAAHASVVPRRLWVDERPLKSGYLEAVAAKPSLQRRGLGSLAVMALEPSFEQFELCALSTGVPAFYARLGWERWRGRTWVRTERGLIRTADEDAGIMIRRTGRTGGLSLEADIICEERDGEDW